MHEPKVLITGATGAVGGQALHQLFQKQSPESISVFIRPSKRAKKLVQKYPGINVFYGDITTKRDLDEACNNQDYIFHLAAVIPPVANKQPQLTKNVNIEGTRNVVETMERIASKALLIYSSSVAVYGDRNDNPDITLNDPLTPSARDYYAETKIASESIIKNSSIRWSIYRLAAIMGVGNHKISGIIFQVPLETPMEICTVRDTSRAFVNSIGKDQHIERKTFNLGGGETCRISYEDFMTRAFSAFGMGKVDFPKYAFAKINFHCGNYMDGDDLEEILRFRQDTLDTYFERFKAAVPGIQRLVTKMVNKPVKMVLLRVSEPYKAHKKQDKEMIEHFFGEKYLRS